MAREWTIWKDDSEVNGYVLDSIEDIEGPHTRGKVVVIEKAAADKLASRVDEFLTINYGCRNQIAFFYELRDSLAEYRESDE